MRWLLCLLVLFMWVVSDAQLVTRSSDRFLYAREKYFSLNPFGFVEGAMASGIGFGTRFSQRSEYFTELSYLGKNLLYPDYVNSLHGGRLIAQYRYHFLKQLKPNFDSRSEAGQNRTNSFVGLEFRLKTYNFSNTNNFVNRAVHDTLSDYLYKATAHCLGGAIIFGTTSNIDTRGKWKFEFTFGIGVKQKTVEFKNVPGNYQPIIVRAKDWGFPTIFESTNTPYFPIGMRMRHVLN